MALDYVWPLSNNATPNVMNTSFGPRINRNHWDFHDGIDLPAPRRTPVHATRNGVVHHAGPGGTGGYSSRHVVVQVEDPTDGPLYNVYLHLDGIDPAVVTNGTVAQGQLIGTVGDDDATYCHLHFEFRRRTFKEIGSVHPLTYLPYTDTSNFFFAGTVRTNRLDAFRAVRIPFGAGSKLQGDLKRVEVDLQSGTRVLTTRIVDFDDKQTVNDAKGDSELFVDDIGVEGYQRSDMVKHGRSSLAYGILVRKVPWRCSNLVARVLDVGGNVVTSRSIAVANRTPVDEFIDFEDGQLPPAGWTTITSADPSGTEVSIEAAAAHSGSRGMRCVDDSSTEADPQRAGIAFSLPPGRFEWRAQAWLNPIEMGLDPGEATYLLHFLSGTSLSVAARIRNDGGTLRAGLIAKEPDGTFVSDDAAIITAGRWRRWRLELLRVATRETTAILYLDDGGRMTEQARLNWDSAEREPTTLRAGIGFSSSSATATVLIDELWLTESGLSS